MLTEKEQKYIKLINQISMCHCCECIKIPSFDENGECLLNDTHGLPLEASFIDSIDGIYVNRWNCWQGSLNAEIMLIGQDYGNVDNIQLPQHSSRWRDDKIQTKEDAQRKWNSPTDANLFYLFKEIFGINLGEQNDKLYFTNLACCYRKNRTSGKANDAWFYICANRYMGKLISIIQPKVIIALGEKVFNALGYCENAKIHLIETSSAKSIKRMNYSDFVSECRFELSFSDSDSQTKSIPVYPVFHPGAYSNKNRPLNMQLNDWERIKLLESI